MILDSFILESLMAWAQLQAQFQAHVDSPRRVACVWKSPPKIGE